MIRDLDLEPVVAVNPDPANLTIVEVRGALTSRLLSAAWTRRWFERGALAKFRGALTERGQWPVEPVDCWTDLGDGRHLYTIWTAVPRLPDDPITYPKEVL